MGIAIFQRYAIRDLAATSARVDSRISSNMASPDRCARIVNIEERRLNAKKGTFPKNAVRNVPGDWILLKGNQSRTSRTKGSETAMGLLNKARMKNPSARRYGLDNVREAVCRR